MDEQTKPQTPVGEPLGDTGDGDTGVPEFEQGISNRPGDKDPDRVDGTDQEDRESEGQLDQPPD